MLIPRSIFATKDPLSRVTQEMDRLFESLAPSSLPLFPALELSRITFPALNIWEEGDEVYAEAELPGVRREDIEVSATKNWLSIKGRRDLHHDEKNNVMVLRKERASGTFERSVELPFEIETDKVSAVFKDGVLKITMPKAKEARRRLIKIKSK